MNYSVRLNVLLQKRGVASRRHADELIEKGLVAVNGVVINQLGAKVARNARLTVDGVPYCKSPRRLIYILHKPPFVMCTRHDAQKRKTIFDLPSVQGLPANVQNVGRLDYHSEGLMILTNDGELSYAIAHPKHNIEKVYLVFLSAIPTRGKMEKLRRGVTLHDGFAQPKRLTLLHQECLGQTKGQWIEIVITEGRNRLVRRMFEYLGFTVVRLIRTAIGEIKLPRNLEPGEVRPVSSTERRYLKNLKTQQDAHLERV